MVPAQISASMVAVTPIFAAGRRSGEALEMRSTDLGADLEDRCNRVLRDRCSGMTITEVLQGSEVTL